MGHFENRSSEVHPEANLTGASLIDDGPVPKAAVAVARHAVATLKPSQ